jgi:hypothetical protein
MAIPIGRFRMGGLKCTKWRVEMAVFFGETGGELGFQPRRIRFLLSMGVAHG